MDFLGIVPPLLMEELDGEVVPSAAAPAGVGLALVWNGNLQTWPENFF